MARFIIEGGSAVHGTVTPAGNKNEALPALMACLLTEEPVTLQRMPRIQDVLSVCAILEKLGVEIQWDNDETVTLCAKNVARYDPDPELCAHIRASILLLGPLLARFGKILLPT